MPGSRTGIGEIATTLRKQGINATVQSAWDWQALATEAAAKYKRGQLRVIILVGYSAGAGSVASMTARLGELGVPVKLAITLDSVFPSVANGRVERFVNYYGRGMSVGLGGQFSGKLQNVYLDGIPNLDHSNLGSKEIVQRRVIQDIDAAINNFAARLGRAPTR